MKLVLKIAAAVVALSSATVFAANADNSVKAMKVTKAMTAQALVSKISHGQLKVESSFDATHGLTGHVLKAQAGPAEEVIAYTNKDNSLLFIGNLISSTGENLTGKFTNKYITSKKAVKAYSDIGVAHYVVDGKNSAPHKTYVFMDPNCSYCHLLYKEIQPFIQQGQLQVRWIPVAIRPESMGKTARILHADTKNAAQLIAADEAHFDMKTEQGSLKPLKKSKDKSVQNAYAAANTNTNLFISHFLGTPVILFKNQAGQPQVIPGFIQGAQLKATIDSMSSKW